MSPVQLEVLVDISKLNNSWLFNDYLINMNLSEPSDLISLAELSECYGKFK